MTISGSCHCGAVSFTLATAPEYLTECNCTYCSRIGGRWSYYPPEALTMRHKEGDKVYKPRLNEHHFCERCGCTIYNLTPTWSPEDGTPDFSRMQVAINTRMLVDVDLDNLPVEHLDGRHLW